MLRRDAACLAECSDARRHTEQAIKNGREVLELLIESAAKNKEPLPIPERKHSGNLRLRLPVSLHGRLALEAEREGVSLNQWIVSKLSR